MPDQEDAVPRTREARKCATCQAPIAPHPGAGRPRKYCAECSPPRERKPGRPRRDLRLCPGCGLEKLIRRGSVYCSYGCFSENASARLRKTENPGYRASHKRVTKARGRASGYPCAFCGLPARHWSQVHGTDMSDPRNFRALCVPCHTAYDKPVRSPKRLTAGDRAEILRLYAETRELPQRSEGRWTYDSLAAKFSVSRSTVDHILMPSRRQHGSH